jgi:acyl-CoA synthetase (AMP-forming)/AMP-acid ligase II
LLVHGDNVFPGYLGEVPSPFLKLRGKRWYNSGDLGLLDNGRLVLSGRLKRFVKIGGEMVSLPAVEEALLAQISCPDDTPCIAVHAAESEAGGRPELYLFTTLPLNREAANDILRKAGLPNLVRIREVVKLAELPLLGTGKINYRALKT